MNICVFCGASEGNAAHREKAFELGKMIATKGHRLIYGGSVLGLMGCLAKGAKEGGGEVVSIIPAFFSQRGVDDPLSDKRISVETMGERKDRMIEMSDLFIALPGGIGTLDEIGDTLTLIALRRKSAQMVLCDFDGFYSALKEMLGKMKEEGYIPSPWLAEPLYAKSLSEIEPLL